MRYTYYKTKYARYSPSDVFVYLGNNELYCPIGQHSTLSTDYLVNDCKRISKRKYIEVSKNLYTPPKYIA